MEIYLHNQKIAQGVRHMARLSDKAEQKFKDEIPNDVKAYLDAGGKIMVAPKLYVSVYQANLERERRKQASRGGAASKEL